MKVWLEIDDNLRNFRLMVYDYFSDDTRHNNDFICAQRIIISQAVRRFLNLFYQLKLLNFSNLSTCDYLLLITIFVQIGVLLSVKTVLVKDRDR